MNETMGAQRDILILTIEHDRKAKTIRFERPSQWGAYGSEPISLVLPESISLDEIGAAVRVLLLARRANQ